MKRVAAAMGAALVASAAGACSKTAPAIPADAYVPLDAPTQTSAGPGGGTIDQLNFAVVGDTRPVNIDDTVGYPTPIVQQIFTDVNGDPAAPRFALTTGDYMYASTDPGNEVNPQLDAYLGARAAYMGFVYPAMGNHECNGFTKSNCGTAGVDGFTPNYNAFMARMIAPLGETRPYYIERFAAADKSWTAKIVVIAANAWSQDQAAWLDTALSEPTTYTFVVRHEPPDADTAPGVGPTTITLSMYPLTMLITGHTHTYLHIPAYREIVVGNGGAPLTGDIDYGFVIVVRQPDGTLQVTAKDYMTLATIDQFAVNPDGTLVGQ